jgi:hypothetical protein
MSTLRATAKARKDLSDGLIEFLGYVIRTSTAALFIARYSRGRHETLANRGGGGRPKIDGARTQLQGAEAAKLGYA